jgi:hypothetical protein
MNDICTQSKIFRSERRATLEKPISVKAVLWVYKAAASKTLYNMLEDYRFLSLVKGRDNRLKVSDPLVDEKDSASWSKTVLRITKNNKIYRGADKSLARPTSHVFCWMVRIFLLMLVLFYIYIVIILLQL